MAWLSIFGQTSAPPPPDPSEGAQYDAPHSDHHDTTEERDRLTNQLFSGDHARAHGRGPGYCEAGGGEFYRDPSIYALFSGAVSALKDEFRRSNYSNVTMVSPGHRRPPSWLEYKEVAIDGRALREDEMSGPSYWRNKYSRQLDIADAVLSVKQKKLVEQTHDVIGFVQHLRRGLGWAPPVDHYMRRRLAELGVREEEMPSAYRQAAVEKRRRDGSEDTMLHAPMCYEASASPSRAASQGAQHRFGGSPEADFHTHHPPNSLTDEVVDADVYFERGKLVDMPAERAPHKGALWTVLMESVQRGKPLTHVAQKYRPRIDYYGLDAFLDSAASLMWLSVKVGIAVGLFQGTVRAFQAINVDAFFLKASGVGALSILNMSVAVSVIKWGGNMALLSGAFCIGDRLAQVAKHYYYHYHNHHGAAGLGGGGGSVQHSHRRASSSHRTTVNYAMGLACSGATVAVMPWWILNDGRLALRMAVSGMCVGGVLGLGVGVVLSRLVVLNLSRLDASNQQLRRYEALLLRSREWVKAERARCSAGERVIWW